MARPKDERRCRQTRLELLQTGLELMIRHSYHGVGINQVLETAGVPKGSFYHYFKSKEDFAEQVLAYYLEQQQAFADGVLASEDLSPYERLKRFFEQIIAYFKGQGFAQGCLMSNLSQELADCNETLRPVLKTGWQVMSEPIERCLAQMDKADIGLAHLSDHEAAIVLLHAWNGAMIHMKVEKSAAPLELFLKSFFLK